jgi:5-formyltetrahydrofolate cyclo-ligase
MVDDTVEAKRSIRAAALADREGQPSWRRNLRSRVVHRRATRISALARAKLVLAYFPVRGEVDVRFMIKWCFRTGRDVALPRVTGGGKTPRLEFHLVRSLNGIKPGAFGIPEPDPDPASRVDAARADVIVVPGLVFSPAGDRIGYGGGYYDAVLARCSAVTVGVAFDSQMRDTLPRARHDVPVRSVVTDRRTVFPGATG